MKQTFPKMVLYGKVWREKLPQLFYALLEVSTDYLMEGSSEEVPQAHIHDRELLQQFKQVQDLDERDQEMVKTFIDALITKRRIQKMAK